MRFTDAIRWLVKARDFAYARRTPEMRDATLAQYPWNKVSICVKQALRANDPSATHLNIPLEDIDKNQMALMFLSAQALVPFSESERASAVPCDSRVVDAFDMVVDSHGKDGQEKSPFQRRVLGTSFFVQDFKRKTGKTTTLVSEFSTKKAVSTFERVLYLSFVLQAVIKARPPNPSKYAFKRTKHDLCQRLGHMIGLIVDAFNLLAKTCSYDSIEVMIAPYIIWNSSDFKFDPITSRSKGYAPKSQSLTLKSTLEASRDAAIVDSTAFQRSDDTDKALRLVAKTFLEELHACVLDGNLVAPVWRKEHTIGRLFFSQGNGDLICPRLLPLRKELHEQFPIPAAVSQEWENCDIPSHDESSMRHQTTSSSLEPPVSQTVPPSASHLPPQSTSKLSPPVLQIPSRRFATQHHSSSPSILQDAVQRASQSTSQPSPQLPVSHFANTPLPSSPTLSQHDSHSQSAQLASHPIAQHISEPETGGASQNEVVPSEFVQLAIQDVPATRGKGQLQSRKTRNTRKATPLPLTADELVVEKHIKPFVEMYNCSFTDLLNKYDERHKESQDLLPRQSLRGNVQLLLTDPPYGIRAASEKNNSDYDTLTRKQMEEVVKLAQCLLRVGGHGIIFCSFQQLNAWRVLIAAPKREDGKGMFRLSAVPYNFLKAPGIHRTGVTKKSTSLRPTGEIAVHFVKRGLSHDDQVAMVDYDACGEVPSRFPGYSNTIDNVPELERGEQLRFNGKAVRNEQKSLLLIRELVRKHTKPKDLVADLFSGTYTTAVACITVPRGLHRRFVGCELSELAHHMARRRVISCFSKLIVSNDIQLEETDTPPMSAIQGIVFTSLQARREAWRPLQGYPTSTFLPEDTVHFISRLLNDPSLHVHSTTIPDEWPLQLQERLLSIDTTTVRAFECIRNSVYISKSTIKSLSAGLGLFAAKPLRKNSVIGYYYGSLVYDNLLKRSSSTRMYGDRMSYVTKNRFQKFAIGLHIDAQKLQLPPNKEIFLVPSEYNVFRFVNDYRYLPDDEEKDQPSPRRKPNVQFWQPDVIHGTGTLKSPQNIKIKALDNISANTELFIDYGPEYIFPTEGKNQSTKLAGNKRKRAQQ